MSSKDTTPLSGQFTKTVGAGVSSLVNPGNKTYYILEHCVTSKFHQMGEAQRIIVDNIEIGRDPRCQVRYDEDFQTVSRRHAAIVRDGNNWKLVQISKTNSTLLNGRRVTTEWYLQNGDEIQISVNGPKLRFIIPTGDRATVDSINFTQRLNLFRQQALKPYKYGMAALSAVLLAAVGAIIYMGFFMKGVADDVNDQSRLLAQAIADNADNAAVADSLARELMATNAAVAANAAKLVDVEAMAGRAQQIARRAASRMSPTPAEFAQVAKNVYYIVVNVYLNDEYQFGYSGTGFLLSDGRFVTAKHCVDMGYNHAADFSDDQSVAMLNSLHYFQPEALKYKMIGVSGSGDRISLTYTPTSSPWTWGHTDYTNGTVTVTDESGEKIDMPVKYSTSMVGADDWAYISTGKTGGLEFDTDWSRHLGNGTPLHILGFPRSVGTEEYSETGRVTPNYCQSAVGQDAYDGIILLANDEVDHGNSGGPVFAQRDGRPIAIGIISGKERLGARGSSTDYTAIWKSRVVPLSAMN